MKDFPRKIMKLKHNNESETLDPPFVKHSLIRVQKCFKPLFHTYRAMMTYQNLKKYGNYTVP